MTYLWKYASRTYTLITDFLLCFHIVGTIVQAQLDLPTDLAKGLMLNDARVKRVQVCNVLSSQIDDFYLSDKTCGQAPGAVLNFDFCIDNRTLISV